MVSGSTALALDPPESPAVVLPMVVEAKTIGCIGYESHRFNTSPGKKVVPLLHNFYLYHLHSCTGSQGHGAETAQKIRSTASLSGCGLFCKLKLFVDIREEILL